MSNNVEAGDIQQWPIEKLIPYEKNAKIHDPKDVSDLKDSILKIGFRGFIRVDKNGVIIGGHKRRLAAMAAGLDFIPVIVDDHLSENDVKAARLADNRVHGARYDESIMQGEIVDLDADNFDFSGLGFEEREIDFFTKDLVKINIDALIIDLDAEVEEQTARTDKKAAEVNDEKLMVSIAFGFGKVTIAQSRTIGQFMAQLKEETGGEGAEGLTSFFKSLLNK